MSNELSLAYQGRAIRVVGDKDNPEWVAVDLWPLLGLKGEPSDQLKRFRDTEKGTAICRTPQGGLQEMLTVKEPGLYRLLSTCRKPEARCFQDWVFGEVLPSIRKHGCYPPPEVKVRDGAIVRVDEEALGRAIGYHMGLIQEHSQKEFTKVNDKIDRVDEKVDEVACELKRVSKRRELASKTKELHVNVVYRQFGGKCPCCDKKRIVNSHGQRMTSGQFDHWRMPSQNSKEWTWLVCTDCNGSLRDGQFHREHQRKFDHYQETLRRFENSISPQLPGFDECES